MKLAPVVERLRSQAAASFREIGTAADLAALLTSGVPQTPSAFVVPLEETAGDNYLATGATAQHVDVSFMVHILIRSATGGARGTGAMDDLDTLRAAVMAAIHGWEPEPDALPCLFVRGELSTFEGGALSWTDQFRTGYDLRTIQ